MNASFQRYSLRKARSGAEDCLVSLTLNFQTVYSRIATGLSQIPLIETNLEYGGHKSRFDQRCLFKDIDRHELVKKGFWHFSGREKIIYASPKKKAAMLREIVEFCSDVIAVSAKGQLS